MEIEKELFPVPWTEFDFRMILLDISFNFVLTENDKIAGYICSILESKDSVYLLNFAISKEYQKRGYGTRFLYFFLYHLLKSSGINNVILEVRESNKIALKLYKKFGFTIIDKRIGYYQSPQEDALIMALKI